MTIEIQTESNTSGAQNDAILPASAIIEGEYNPLSKTLEHLSLHFHMASQAAIIEIM
jgi:hypothetical protein